MITQTILFLVLVNAAIGVLFWQSQPQQRHKLRVLPASILAVEIVLGAFEAVVILAALAISKLVW